ncbi:MAG: dihydrodipicolinate synthase family protein, partial [Verrucomicrobia bacterium]
MDDGAKKINWPVMLTPFDEAKEIDWNSLDSLVDWYLEAGAGGLFSVCLSGEMHDLTNDERIGIAAHVVSRVNGKIPVIASGTFGNTNT